MFYIYLTWILIILVVTCCALAQVPKGKNTRRLDFYDNK